MNSLNLNVSGLPKSATLAINERSAKLQREGRTIYKFGLGQSPFPVPSVVQEELKKNVHQKAYLDVEGLPELREAVARFFGRQHGANYRGDQVLVGPGSKELMFLLQLVYYGDLVIPTPSWVSYAPQAHIIGRQVKWLPARAEDNWLLHPEDLEALCQKDPDRPRIVILNYPSNPTGATFSEDELREIARIARKFDLVILSDEIYSQLHHDGQHISIAQFYPEGTIISGGLSKWCGAGGWRLGTFLFPEAYFKLKDTMAVAASETFTSTSAPIQYAAVAAYQQNPELTEYLNQARHILKLLARHIVGQLNAANIKVPLPAGGFYLFPSFSYHTEALAQRSVTNSEALCEYLLKKTGVATLPASAFGCHSSGLSLRMAYVDFDGEKAMNNYHRLTSGEMDEQTYLNTYCPNVVEGIDRLVEEVKNW